MASFNQQNLICIAGQIYTSRSEEKEQHWWWKIRIKKKKQKVQNRTFLIIFSSSFRWRAIDAEAFAVCIRKNRPKTKTKNNFFSAQQQFHWFTTRNIRLNTDCRRATTDEKRFYPWWNKSPMDTFFFSENETAATPLIRATPKFSQTNTNNYKQTNEKTEWKGEENEKTTKKKLSRNENKLDDKSDYGL